MRRKQMNNDPNYNIVVFFGLKSARWNVVPWTLISETKPGFTAVDTFESRYCQTCVPHVTCFPSSRAHIWSSCSCPRLSSLVSICVLIAPHLFQFSSFDFLLYKILVSPCLPRSLLNVFRVLLKPMFDYSPCLLAP